MPRLAENPRSTFKLKKEYRGHYRCGDLKVYLEELTKFDFFRYVLFVDESDVFNGYMHARILLVLCQMIKEQKEKWVFCSRHFGRCRSLVPYGSV